MIDSSDNPLLKLLWTAKTRVASSKTAYRAYKWATTSTGDGEVYRIRVGPMRGFRWRRDNRFPFWYHLGLYEPHVSALIAAHLRPGDTFWDVGANAGYHTLMASRVVGPTGRVLAIEADPDTCRLLREQMELNQVSNCEVLHAAVSGSDEPVTLMRQPNNLQSAIGTVTSAGEPLEVPGVALDSLADRAGRPDVVKMDIEGAEIFALPGGASLFTGPRRPRLLLSVHGAEAASFCRTFLREHGYEFQEEEGFEQMWVALPAAAKQP